MPRKKDRLSETDFCFLAQENKFKSICLIVFWDFFCFTERVIAETKRLERKFGTKNVYQACLEGTSMFHVGEVMDRAYRSRSFFFKLITSMTQLN